MKKSYWITGIFLLGILWFLVYLCNETDFCYNEPTKYVLSNETQWFSPEVAPVFNTCPKTDAVFIFFHGYKGSPHNLKKIANHFSNKYNVVLPLYPGHGTTEEDFQQTYFSQWRAYARDVYLEYRKKYATVYICGMSMGGMIALSLGEEFNAEYSPDGIIAISAPVFMNNLLGQGLLYDWRLYFTRFMSWIITEIKETKAEADKDGALWVGYEGGNFIRQVHSLKLAMLRVNNKLSSLKAPLLLMHSKGDKTSPFQNLFYIANQVSSDLIRIRIFDLRKWEHDRHLLTLYHSTRDQVISEIEGFINDLSSGESFDIPKSAY